jgi:hypothetical protein
MKNRADNFTQLHGVQVTYRDGFGNYLKVSKPTEKDFMINVNEHTICITEEDLMEMIEGAKKNPKENKNED